MNVLRKSLSGLTPRLIAIVAMLLAARSLSSNNLETVLQLGSGDIAITVLKLLVDFARLSLVAVPMLIMVTATRNLGPQHGVKRGIALGIAVVVSTGAGLLLRLVSSQWRLPDFHEIPFEAWRYQWPRYALLGGVFTVACEFYGHELMSIRTLQRAELEGEAFEREMADARVQVLLAQIEPHFLFNTLANVRRLYEQDRQAGRAMLEDTLRYLQVALPTLRASGVTLGQDAELVEAFLRIHQVRMRHRLTFSIDIPTRLRPHPIPPMMLLTLVENAIKHGLNPSVAGGNICIAAHCVGNKLLVKVVDSGVGLTPGAGAGTGLANVRSRLAAQFGSDASLELESNAPIGFRATIVLPLATLAEAA